MIRFLVERKLAAAERELGGSLDYVRHILRASLGSFFKFTRLLGLAEHRRALPPAPFRVARIVAARDEDCGTCVQIEVNLARREGVDPAVLQSVLAGRPEELGPELADTYRFAQAVVEATGEEDALREAMRAHWGEAGLVELALGIASARFFPITKRALGHATRCAEVEVVVDADPRSSRA